MRTAVDTNVLIDLLGPPGEQADQAEAALLLARTQGVLVMSVVCYAEVAQNFASMLTLDELLSESQIEVTDLAREQAFAAGTLYLSYRARGGTRERILPDFLVAAHALLDADRLLTLDKRFYGPSFPTLKAITPAELLASHR